MLLGVGSNRYPKTGGGTACGAKSTRKNGIWGGLDGAEQEDLGVVGEAAHPAGGKARGGGGRFSLVLFSHREGWF